MNPGQDTGTIDLRTIIRKLMAVWWLYPITIGLCVAAGVAYIKTTPKLYHVRTTVLMSEKGRNQFGGGGQEFLKGSSLLGGNSDIEDQIAVLTSASNVAKAIKRLDFGISYFERRNFLTQECYQYPPFLVRLDSVAKQVYGVPVHVEVDLGDSTYRVRAEAKYASLYHVGRQEELEEFRTDWSVDKKVRIGEPFEHDGLSFTIGFPKDRAYDKDTDHFFTINSLGSLVAEYQAKTAAAPLSDESSIVEVGSVGEVVAKEKKFLDMLVETYIESELYRRQQKGRKTVDFIEQQIGGVSKILGEKQTDIEATRSKTRVFGVDQSVGVLLERQTRLEAERAQWQRKRMYLDQTLAKLRTDDFTGVSSPPPGMEDPVLNANLIELTRLATDLAAERQRAVRSNPQINALERRLRDLKRSVVSAAEGLLEQASLSLNGINNDLASIIQQLAQMGKTEGTISNLVRDFDLSGNLYNYLVEKKYEASIAVASDQIDKWVVDEAGPTSGKPVKPSKKVVLGGAFLLGLFLPIGLVVVRDVLNDSIVDLEQLKRLSPIPVLTTIPTSKRRRIMPDEPKSLLAESFRTARINLQYLSAKTERRVVGFTSSTSGEGKTFCAVNLATVMALSGKRTVIVDADMRRPRLAETLGLPEGPGLSTHLIGECTLGEATVRTDIPGLDAITAGPIPPNPLELVELPRMAELIRELRERYDQVIVDASPMGLVSEYLVLTGHMDLTLYVVREGHTRRGALRLVNEMVKDGKVERVNLLLNDVDQSHVKGYGYYTK